jgi:small subunit ribosomal protein S16
MLIIRFKPLGRKRRKHYRIVVAQKHRHVSKLSVEDLGWYNPYTKDSAINEARLSHYIDLGIDISDSVRSLLSKQKLLPSN